MFLVELGGWQSVAVHVIWVFSSQSKLYLVVESFNEVNNNLIVLWLIKREPWWMHACPTRNGRYVLTCIITGSNFSVWMWLSSWKEAINRSRMHNAISWENCLQNSPSKDRSRRSKRRANESSRNNRQPVVHLDP